MLPSSKPSPNVLLDEKGDLGWSFSCGAPASAVDSNRVATALRVSSQSRSTPSIIRLQVRVINKGHGGQRARLAEQIVNIRGPRAAAMLAVYAEKAPVAKIVRDYFARYPELLELVRRDKSLAKHATQLEKLAGKLTPKPPKPSKRAR